MFSLLSDESSHGIEKNVQENLFAPFNQRDLEGLDDYIESIDALEAFRILQEVNKEIVTVNLENDVLVGFLQKNHPKMLSGIEQVRRKTTESRTNLQKSRTDSPRSSHASALIRTEVESRTLSACESTIGSNRRVNTEYRINYRTKSEIAEQLAEEIHKNCEALEARGMNEIKLLNGQIEELRYQCADTEETINSFELNFIKNNTLENATEKLMESNLRQFINNWLKNGRALLGTMRLKITTLQEQCHQQRTSLISKADLSGMLGPVDFEQLQIKRDEQTKSLDEKNVSLAGLKESTGKASLARAKEKKLLLTLENKSKALTAKTEDIARSIYKLELESKAVENEVIAAEEGLKNLKAQVEAFEAPSVTDYIRRKEELIVLEKEEKLLQRKSYIQNIKLKNIAIKLRMQDTKSNLS